MVVPWSMLALVVRLGGYAADGGTNEPVELSVGGETPAPDGTGVTGGLFFDNEGDRSSTAEIMLGTLGDDC